VAGECFRSFNVVFYGRKGSSLVAAVGEIVAIFKEAGIVDKRVKDNLSENLKEEKIRAFKLTFFFLPDRIYGDSQSQNEAAPLPLSALQGAFTLLALSIAISLAVFAAEISTWKR